VPILSTRWRSPKTAPGCLPARPRPGSRGPESPGFVLGQLASALGGRASHNLGGASTVGQAPISLGFPRNPGPGNSAAKGLERIARQGLYSTASEYRPDSNYCSSVQLP
jgi:hypothetical protein